LVDLSEKLLKKEGFEVGRLHVSSLMKRMGIEALYRRPNTSKPMPGHKVYPYLLRGLVIDRPNQVWATDITYIPMARGFIYLTAVIDWFTRRVLSWRVSITLEAAFCIESCLQDAGLRSDEVDAVVSHGTGTPANDRAEAEALRSVFGERPPWVNAPKSMIGHLSMACGAVESVIAVLALREDFFPATTVDGWEGDEGCGVRMAPAPGVKGVRSVLKPSFGFGGQNACLLFRRGEF
jgi:3-oxoacyl-(acyl-carrier-protein) synthase